MSAPAFQLQNAPAKINLFLHVVGKREDGYHDLQSLAVFTEHLQDRLRVQKSDKWNLTVSGPFADHLLPAEDNILERARLLLSEGFGENFAYDVSLEKNIPIAAGLGGASADAAALLRIACERWKLPFYFPKLMAIAKQLGADVPVCLSHQAAFFAGLGERMYHIQQLPEFWLLLAKPPQALSTAAVFARFAGKFSESRDEKNFPRSFASLEELVQFLQNTRNDLLPAAQELCPEIAPLLSALQALENVRHSGLSGSGATCFALFADQSEAKAAEEKLKNAHPHWWQAVARIKAVK
ncbi:MAG: 4-(cytidine 5'-diphospho)-2-C-methyl-D-erythritol kinase [Dongiaceae bacterium]